MRIAIVLLAFALAPDEEVRRLQRDAILIDTHNDAPMRTRAGFDIGKTAAFGDTDLVRLRAGGLGAQFFSAYVPASMVAANQSAHRALEMIDTIRHDIVARHPNRFVLALTAADIVEAHRAGKIAALIGIEGGHAIEDSLRLLRDYYALGVRYMTLTHSNTNGWADSSGDIRKAGVKHHGGLTEFGRSVVREMNRLGMLVDVSHVADDTFWDVMETSSAPVIASHSSCRALTPELRNMTDDMIRAMAKKGGVIHINFACSFLTRQPAVNEARKALQKKTAARLRSKSSEEHEVTLMVKTELERGKGVPVPATIGDVLAHIDHVVKIAGVDAVGLGSDFDGIDCAPAGLEDVSKYPNLIRALLEKGYRPEHVKKILGGNTLRVLRAAEKVAGK